MRPDPALPAQPLAPGGSALPAERILADSIGALPRALRGSIVTNVVAASLLAFAMREWYPAWGLAAWLAGLVLAQTWRLLFNHAAHRLRISRPPTSPEHKADRLAWDAFILAAYWGISSVFFFDAQRALQPFYWALVLGGTAAGSIGAHAHHPRTMWIFLPTLIAPFALRALVDTHNDSRFLGVGMLLLLAYLLYYGKQHARTLQRMIALRHENSALVEELQTQALALHEANAAKSRFFAAASHDLRQPLQAMGLYLSVISSGDNNPKALARMGQCMESLDRLLEVVMDISRLDAGQVTPQYRPVCIASMLHSLVNMYEAAAQQKGLQLRAHPTKAWTSSDPALLERMLANLVSNAIRYTSTGGVLLGVRPHGEGLRIMVTDTGIGIPAHAHAAVFEEFVQLNNYERDPAQGTGLGLATVQRLAVLLGHRVELHSTLGRGTTFALHVPRIASPAVPAVDTGADLAGTVSAAALQGHVLVVEDNPMVQNALASLLSRWGLRVTAVENGALALHELERTAFDVVLSDWRLPGPHDGTSVLRTAKILQPGMKLAVLMTGEDEHHVTEVPGDVPVLRKPVRPLRLRALLQSHLVP
ncbi:MAG: hybrid sensor histidine kinase/response regulator [Burkholderiaceae bacterium]|nr:hybrid sensor histidine kinase/response regulator [Burkholderiaceae bacterium]MCO5112249.1 hybrid sensor histidine kinase/response regulator [Burkholderiaceae bacterium]